MQRERGKKNPAPPEKGSHPLPLPSSQPAFPRLPKHDFIPAGPGRGCCEVASSSQAHAHAHSPSSLPAGTPPAKGSGGGRAAVGTAAPLSEEEGGSARGDRGGRRRGGGARGLRGAGVPRGTWPQRSLGRLLSRGEWTGRPGPRSHPPHHPRPLLGGGLHTPTEGFAGGEDAENHSPGPGGRRGPHQSRLGSPPPPLSFLRRGGSQERLRNVRQPIAKRITSRLMQSPCPPETGGRLAQSQVSCSRMRLPDRQWEN